MAETERADLTSLTVELLSAFVSNNSIESGDLAGLIRSTHTALAEIDAPAPVEPPAPEFEPAVTVRKSLGSRDHILSLIDGKPYKTLKRHLRGHGLTPSQYRERYRLPADYPMVAPSYSEHRRGVAQRLGLGFARKSAKVPEAVIASASEPAASEKGTPGPAPTPVKARSKPGPKKAAAKATTSGKPGTLEPPPGAEVAAAASDVSETPSAHAPADAASSLAAEKPSRVKRPASRKPRASKAGAAAPAGPEAKPKAARTKKTPKARAVPAPTE